MVNPLSEYLTVEERLDGVYLKVSRQDQAKVGLETLAKALERAITLNYDFSKIAEVYHRASDAFERIGPAFEYYEPEIDQYIQFSATPERATMALLSGAVSAGIAFTGRKLARFLEKKGIRHGIRTDVLEKMCAESLYKISFEVATGTPPVPGEDSSFDFLVPISPDARPQTRDDGSVDFREIRSFVSVAAKQVIAKKKNATPGTPGVAVTGDPIPAAPGKDKPLPAGKNTEVSPDGNSLLASKAGIIIQEGGLVSVFELLDIKGDVDFSIGNIKYRGGVIIHGNVLPGFVVEAEGSVHIKGDVESARVISRYESVTIERGIIGKGDTLISAKKEIHIAFAQEAAITTEGMLTVEKYLLNCDVTCCTMKTKDGRGSIIGGRVRAEQSIQAGQAGSAKGNKTKLVLFDRERELYEEKLTALLELEKKILVEQKNVERQLKLKSALVKKFSANALRGSALAETKKWIDAYYSLNAKIKYVRHKSEEVRAAIEKTKTKSYDGFIKIAGSTYPGVVLDLYDRYRTMSDVMVNTRFTLNNTEIGYG